MKKIDILWLAEHVARELDVACAVKYLVEKRYGLKIEIKHIYLHANEVMKEYRPKIVAVPFLYNSSDLAISDFLKRWPHAIYFNLAWEEIFYKGHLTIKAPSDNFARDNVIHHAWGDFYKKYLIENKVAENNIYVNGNPAFALYLSPYKQFYRQRDWLAEKYGLAQDKKWILVPENYRWAFIKDYTIKWRTSQGADVKELLEMRKFAKDSLIQLLQWCNHTAKNHKLLIIFRPKPVTMLKEMEDFFNENVRENKSDELCFIKGESVREWILACDMVISSFSTTLIEAAIAGKPAYMVEPLPIIDSFSADWYQYVPCIKNGRQFENVCVNGITDEKNELKMWAMNEMLNNGDPISNLSDFLYQLVKRYEEKQVPFSELTEIFCRAAQGIRPKKNYFNTRTHENDRFDDELITDKTNRWSDLLF